jgi:hypothetical protein
VGIAEQARRAAGCLDSRSPPICSTRGRINIFERWESQAARETFRSSGPEKEQRAASTTRGQVQEVNPEGKCRLAAEKAPSGFEPLYEALQASA